MIDFKRVSKSFGVQRILNDASFSIGSGERVGIVGPNGSGKSTVFSLLVGELSPDAGEITFPKGMRIGHLHQQIDMLGSADTVLEYAESGMPEIADLQRQIDLLEDQLSRGDNTGNEGKERLLKRLGELQTRFEAIDGYTVRNRAEAALSGLGFSQADMHRPFPQFSGGWQMRAELVRVVIADPAVLLLDEPSNYLDIPAVEWLQRFLKEYSGTLLLISHDRYLLNSLTCVTIEIANAEATRYPGPYDFYMKERVLRYEQMLASKKNQDKKREQTEKFIERFRAKNTKASAVQSRIKMLDKMQEISVPRQIVSRGHFRIPSPVRCGREVVLLENAGFTYDGGRWILKGVNFRMERGDKLALVGLNGLGKTTFLRLLAGQLDPSEGKRKVGHKVERGYQSQEFAETISGHFSAYEAVKSAGGDAVTDRDVRSMLGEFGFSGKDVEKKVQVLSGGEKVRLAFARMLIHPPNFLLLDEPTTHLDIAARESLEAALSDFEGTLCIVSHDIEFVRRVATGIVAMTPPGIKVYSGGYDYYCEKISTNAVPVRNRPSISARTDERRRKAETVQKYSQLRRELQKELRKVESRIEEFEAQQGDILARLAVTGADYAVLNREMKEIQQKLSDYNARWEAFAIEMDELDREYKATRQ